MFRKLALAFALALSPSLVLAQATTWPPPAGAIAGLGVFNTVLPTMTNGQVGFLQVDSSGRLITVGSGGGGSSTVTIVPSTASSSGITPIVSTSAESSHVFKAGAGNAYSAYATNLTSTAGFFVLLNSTTAPGDGAITPLACAALAPNGSASINYAPGPPGVFSTGITAVVTSAVTCFTKTTGVITAFISGSVQ